MNHLIVTMAPQTQSLRMLFTDNGREVLQAILGPPSQAHPKAVSTLLEGLSLWYQDPLSVVVCAEPRDTGSALSTLFDELGFGIRNLYYDVGVAVLPERPRRSLKGLGDFQDLRRLSAGPVLR
jgi:hypothetical protein